MRFARLLLYFIATSALLDASPSTAQIRSTATGGLWSSGSSWEGGAVPDATQDVVIVSGASISSHLARHQVASLRVEPGARLEGRIAVWGDVLLQGEAENLDVLAFGSIRNEGAIISGSIAAAADFFNNGSWQSGRLSLLGSQARTVHLTAPDVTVSVSASALALGFEFIPPRPVLTGHSTVPTIYAPARGGDVLVVDPGASLTVLDNLVTQFGYENGFWLENYGEIILHHPEVESEFDQARVEGHGAMFDLVLDDLPDSVSVTTYGHQAPDNFPNAVRRYWQIESYPESRAAFFDAVQFQAMGSEMPAADLESLSLFHSADGGISWTPISPTSMRTQEDLTPWGTTLNTILIEGSFPLSGMYALAASEPMAQRAGVTARIIGRDQLRVGGPPAEYRVHVQNTGNTRVYRGLLRLDTEGGVFIDHIVAHAHGTRAAEGLRFDQAEFSLYDDSTSAMLVTPELAAGESRLLSVFLGAIPGHGFEEPAGKRAPQLWGAIAGAVVVGIAKGYLTDLGAAALEETLADPCGDRTDVRDKLNAAFDAADAKWSPFTVGPWNSVAENAASSVADDPNLIKVFSEESSTINRALGRANALNDLKTMADAASNGFDRYENDTGRSVFKPLDCGDDPPPRFPEGWRFDLSPELVSSYDPNAKLGPVGAGTAGFITSAGTFTYRILFENLAEATAPAYRVVIVDTLSDVFTAESVRTTQESHEGFVFSRTDNVLRWEIEGIELPPNVNPPEGEGFVEFTVEAKQGLESGTELANRAEIVFDLNEPILTNTYLNTLDFSPPTTTIVPLSDVTTGDSLTIEWSSDDGENGSGASSTALFMSVDRAPYRQVGTTTGGAMRVGVVAGRNYSFYALSRDAAGNVETEINNVVETSVVVSSEDAEQPLQFALRQAFPNPFNPSTTIAFALAREGQVSLRVYNVLGQQVGLWDWGAMKMGNYMRTIDLGSLSSGIYFYEIRVRDRSETIFRDIGRAVLVK